MKPNNQSRMEGHSQKFYKLWAVPQRYSRTGLVSYVWCHTSGVIRLVSYFSTKFFRHWLTYLYFFLVCGQATPALGPTREFIVTCSLRNQSTSWYRVGCVMSTLWSKALCQLAVELLVWDKSCKTLSLTFQSSCGKAGHLLCPRCTGSIHVPSK